MARARRDLRAPNDIWPGFVDALSTLLLVFVFLLVVFVLAQTFLNRLLQGKDETLARLERSVAELSEMLALEQAEGDSLRRNVARLTSDLEGAADARDALRSRAEQAETERDAARERLSQAELEQARLTQTLEAMRVETREVEEVRAELAESQRTVQADRETIELQLAQLASLRRDIDALEKTRADLESQVTALAGMEEVARRLRDRTRVLEAELADAAEQTVLAQRELEEREVRLEELLRTSATREDALAAESARASAAQQDIDELTRAIGLLRDRLLQVGAALDAEQDTVEAQNRQIADLGARLNLALAEQVEELSQFRSDFFGRLRRVLGDRDDVRVVGDRFVFQSEVLFGSGEAVVNDAGRTQLAALAATLGEVAEEFPDELPWIIQVNGHTDARPIRTAQFPSNWELSTARAINVARILQEEGIPAERLAAAGFAEFQPLDPGETDDAYRRNRRIEIKLTTR